MSDVVINKSQKVINSILKLERNQRSVFQYLQKLKSYTCEPTDHNCFIIVRQLKEGLSELALDQSKLLKIVRDKTKLNLEEVRKIENYQSRYHQLEVDMSAYLSQINNHF